MNVCLINPPRIHPKGWGKPAVYQPLALAYTAAVLETENKVTIIDSPTDGWNNLEEIDDSNYKVGLTNKELYHRIKQISPDIVGINVPFSGWSKSAFEVASIVKNLDESIVTVFDGLHPSARPNQCLSEPNVDFIIRGESEYSFQEIAYHFQKGFSIDRLKKIKGIGFRKNDTFLLNNLRAPIKNLNLLPFPARHLLPMDKYFRDVKEHPLRGVINKSWTPIMTSRGCPHRCVFCSVHIVSGRNWRSRSPENVVEELEHVVDKYSIKQIDFIDSNMSHDKKRMEQICDSIRDRNLDLEWYTPDGLRADTLDEKVLKKMKVAGCKKIRLTPESGVQRVVDEVIHKNMKLEDVENALVLARKVGIKVGVFFVLGLVGETKQDMDQTIKFAYKLRGLGADMFHFCVAMPLYGTELYEQAKQGGYLTEDFNDQSLAHVEPLIQTSDFTLKEVSEYCQKANAVNRVITSKKVLKALMHPRKTFGFVKSMLKMNSNSSKNVEQQLSAFELSEKVC
ncbi:MAG: B12-binding domain-containing radical SAM protein [Candidatus Bathyarchaeota archaeon]|nr:B12-binding domain-containing radical SAM protein [Candidatus Bathyarchaeum sp.]